MKRTIIALALGAAVLTGCKDELTQSPGSSLDLPNAITTLELLDASLNGVYARLNTRYGYSGDVALYADGKGGDIYAPDASVNHFRPVVDFQTDAHSGFADGAYRNFSWVAARANSVLENINIPAAVISANQAKVDDVRGQLLALRALAHLELARLFAKLPVVAADVNAPNSGIALYDRVYTGSHKFSRATLQATYDFIVKGFEEAMPLLSKERTVASGTINHWAAAALLSRTYLYMGDYQNALKWAEYVIASGKYPLYAVDEYVAQWSKVGTSESLFEVLTTDKYNAERNSIGYYTTPNGYAEAAATGDFMTFVNAQKTKKDVRANLFEEKSADGKYKAYYTKKYEGQEGASTPQYVNNFKVIRTSELYLIAIESLLMGANSTAGKAADAYFADFYRTRYKDVGVVPSATIDLVMQERRIEFFCEGHRLFDRMRMRESIDTRTAHGVVDYDNYLLQVEIPQREIDIAQGALVQNPRN